MVRSDVEGGGGVIGSLRSDEKEMSKKEKKKERKKKKEMTSKCSEMVEIFAERGWIMVSLNSFSFGLKKAVYLETAAVTKTGDDLCIPLLGSTP